MKQIIIGNRDIVCSVAVNNENTHIRLRIMKLPTPCYGQNRGAKNYRNKIEVIHDIHMDICEDNLKALQRTYEIIQPCREVCIDEVAFLIKPNQKSIDAMRGWFKDGIEVMENKLKGANSVKIQGKLKSFDKFIQESDDDLRFSIKFLKFFKLNEGKEIEVDKFGHENMVLFNTEEFIFDKNCFDYIKKGD